MRFLKGEFPLDWIPTIWDNESINKRYIINNKEMDITLDLWDTAGQSQYDRIRHLSYRHVDIFLLCFSCVERSSLQNIQSKWYPEVQHHSPDSIKILVGTKCDLKEKFYDHELLVYGYINQLEFEQDLNILDDVIDIILMYERGKQSLYDQNIVNRYNTENPITMEDIEDIKSCTSSIDYVETSALTGHNIDKLFEIAAKACYAKLLEALASSPCCNVL